MQVGVKALIRRRLPTWLLAAAESLLERTPWLPQPEWEVLPGGWPSTGTAARGWDDPSVAARQARTWQPFLDTLRGAQALVTSHEDPTLLQADYGVHNAYMTYAYVLALASHRQDRLTVLDWGGGLGHYYVVARALLPNLELDYHCKDLRSMCETGRRLVPEVQFHDDASVTQRTYDVVLASSSLQYSKDWRATLGILAEATRSYLYVSHMPLVRSAGSFVVLQRAYKYGYETEYAGWFLNRDELLSEAKRLGMHLVREFALFPGPIVPRAPERSEYGGFLFRPWAFQAENATEQ